MVTGWMPLQLTVMPQLVPISPRALKMPLHRNCFKYAQGSCTKQAAMRTALYCFHFRHPARDPVYSTRPKMNCVQLISDPSYSLIARSTRGSAENHTAHLAFTHSSPSTPRIRVSTQTITTRKPPVVIASSGNPVAEVVTSKSGR